ncbi:amino acid adenylation domain-containing protein [Amycolatopsis sp. NPDC088138]|uniref:amino acid adenylation domain-containing protein n=1 Tax=Amycolatopsis sp. NPDC088138 TaxID=3363938 RepID=UPI0038148D28
MTKPDARCLHEVFERQVDLTPDALALECGPVRLTYREVDVRANQLARRIRRAGARERDAVGLYLHRSELPILAALACHKAGVAYVPLERGWPAERIGHIVRELKISLCLGETPRLGALPDTIEGVEIVPIDQPSLLSTIRLGPDEARVRPTDLAYVVYTSGTSGRPKGIMAEHGQVSEYIKAFNEVCPTAACDRVYQGFPMSFDGSVEEIWMAFSNGSALVVPDVDAPRFGDDDGRHVAGLGITYLSTIPSLLSKMSQPIPTLRTLVLSGEVCSDRLVGKWHRPGLRIFNVYGPTEATVNSTAAECLPGRPVTIGRPLSGYELHVVDEELAPVPRGETGELIISGETLARGYVNDPGLTAQRFPTLDGLGDGPRRCHRTGDFVRWNDDDELEFVGRADGQVKVRGFRVELAEIESVLAEHPAIRSACVTVHNGCSALAAFAVPEGPAREIDRNSVLSLLASRLPVYMIPGHLDVLTEFPRTTSGKVDRDRLPDPVLPLVRSHLRSARPA